MSHLDKTYKQLFTEVKQAIKEAQVKTVMAANSRMLCLYWQLGNYIVESQVRKGWGAKIIDLLSADLKKEFPDIKGFSKRNLLYMKQFAETYPSPVIEQFIQLELSLKETGVFIPQVKRKLEETGIQEDQFMQQGVAPSQGPTNKVPPQPVAKLKDPLNQFTQQAVAQMAETAFHFSIIGMSKICIGQVIEQKYCYDKSLHRDVPTMFFCNWCKTC